MAGIDELSYGYIRGRFLAGLLDDSDEGDDPNVEPLRGYIELSSTTEAVKVISATPRAATVFPRKLRINLDSQGYLSHQGQRDIAVWATDDPDGTPVGWQWRVSFFLQYNEEDVPYGSFNFEVPSGAYVDLTKVAPVIIPSPGVYITKGDKGEPGTDGTDGRDGSNVIPAATFIGQEIGTSGAPAEVSTRAVASSLSTSLGCDTINEGDSITQSNTDQVNNRWGNGHGTYFGFAMKGRAFLKYNDGIGGTTSAQMLDRFQANVLSRKPSKVRILAGTNDSDAITQTLPNVEQMILRARRAGAEPILHTIPPFGMPPVPAPTTGLSATASATGGTLAAGTYRYKITSRTPQSTSSKTAAGESLGSSSVSVTTSGSTSSVVIEWDRVPDATTHGIYRSSDGGSTYGLIGTVSSLTPAFRDTGLAAGAALPTSATAGAPDPAASDTLKNAKINSVIHYLAQKYGVDLVDFYQLLTDPLTGKFRQGYCSDGVHPTPLAQRLMGELAAQKSRGYPAGLPYLLASPNDPTSLYNNGLFFTGSTSRPSGWGPYGGGVGTETCLPEESILGNAYRITNLVSGVSPWYNQSPAITTGFAPGDKLAFSAMICASGLDKGGILSLSLRDNGQGSTLPGFTVNSTPNSGEWFPWYGEGIVGANATSIYPQWTVQGRGVSAGIAQITIRNLTALGLAS